MPFAEGYVLERQVFQEYENGSPEPRQIHLFFAGRAARKLRKTATLSGQDKCPIELRLRQVICDESTFLIAKGIATSAIAHILREFGLSSDLTDGER